MNDANEAIELVEPKAQIEEQLTPALTLLERFLRNAKDAYDRGGWNALKPMLRRVYADMMCDELTGLFSRKAFFMILRQIVIPRMEREMKSVPLGTHLGSIVMIDLDRFKLINETFGHAGGDAIIREFGKMMREQFRGYDVIGRVGGDEFVVVADGFPSHEIESRLAALKEVFASHPWRLSPINEEDRSVVLTFSFSYNVVPIIDPKDIKDLIDRADREVLKQKRIRRKTSGS